MVRSFRGLGLVVLMLLVVAPLTLFAVLSVFEDESADSIRLSLDGETWSDRVEDAVFASPEPWTPGETRSAIVYVKNSGPAPVDAEVTVLCRSTDDLVRAGHLALATQVDGQGKTAFAPRLRPITVAIDGLPARSSVPLTVTATFDDTGPPGARVEADDVVLELRIRGARSEDAGSPSLLDAAGAQLWLAPVLLLVAAGVAVRGRRLRRASSPLAGSPLAGTSPDVTDDVTD
jgi:hypothetical protein